MPLLRTASIKRKLTLVVMLTTSIALLVAAAQFVINDVRDFRRRIVTDLEILARIVGHNLTSPLQFGDVKEAQLNLAALEAKPYVVAGGVYKDGKLFAQYVAPGHEATVLPESPPPPGHRFIGNRVAISRKIVKDRELVGSIYLEYELVEVWWRVGKNLGLVAAMLLVSAVVAFFVTSRLQQAISRPILDLAQVANTISEKRD